MSLELNSQELVLTFFFETNSAYKISGPPCMKHSTVNLKLAFILV